MKLNKLGAGCVVAAASLSCVIAQTQIDLRTQAKRVDFSSASSTKPSKAGIVLPALCTVGETFLKLDAKPGANLYVCTAANVWTVQGSPLPDYVAGSYGKILINDDAGMEWGSLGGDVSGAPDALSVTRLQGRPVASAAPSNGHVLGWDGTQWSPQPVPIPALTGDVTTSAGSSITTLSSVNSAPGTCGDTTHVCQVTTNAKGQVTQQTPVAVSASGGGGITTLNGLSTGNQNFVNDTNVTISSVGSNHALGWNGVLGLARGGLNSDLSNTGGGHQVLRQSSTGAPVTVGQLNAGDISGLAASATTDATSASNITSGTLPNGRLSAVPNSALANSSVTVTAGNGLSGGGAAALGGSVALNVTQLVNAQTGTSYTVVAGDGGKLITFNNASGVGVTLPQATGAFGAGWYVRARNVGAGTVTITPVTSTIDGSGSLVLQSGQGVEIASDGTNYQTWRGYTWQPSVAGSHQFATGISGAGVVSYAQPGAADVSGLAASATTDATNASNITSGTLPNGRLSAVPNTALANSSLTVAAGNGLSGGGAAALGGSVTLSATQLVNAQIGTSYTIVAGDGGKLLTFNNAAAVSVTLPQATGAFGAGWYARVRNLGAGAATITPVTSTIDGAASLVLQSGQGVEIASDGANYKTWRGYTWQPSTAGSHQFATGISGAGVVSYGQPAAADISGLATSATTDATNASNISSGTFGAGRLPQFSGGDVTTSAAGSSSLTIGTGRVTNGMLAGGITISKLTNLQGSGSSLLTAGAISGVGSVLCTDGSGGATTTGCPAGGGSGTVSVVGSGSLTSTALVTGGGNQALQTPNTTATMDANGNIQTPGTLQVGSGSGNAGAWAFIQGSATAAPTNSVGFQAPTSVPSSYRITLPSAPAAGVVSRTGTTPSVESILPLQGTDANVLTAGTVSGTGSLLCTDANGGATTAGCSGGGGGGFSVNGSAVSNANLSNSTPAPETGYLNLKFQASGSNVSGEAPFGTSGGTFAVGNDARFVAVGKTPMATDTAVALTQLPADFICAAASASGTAYTCNFAAPPAALVDGEYYALKADVDNTGAATFAFNSFGPKAVTKTQGGVGTALAAGDIRAGAWIVVRYDGTRFQMVSQLGNAPGQVYPGAGVPNSTGSAWGTSYSVGAGANNLPQLDGSGKLLTAVVPTLNQNTTGNAATSTNVACAGIDDTAAIAAAAGMPGIYNFPYNGTCVVNGPVSAWTTSNIVWNLNGTTIKHRAADTRYMLDFSGVSNFQIKNGSLDMNGVVRVAPAFLVHVHNSSIVLEDVTFLNSGTAQPTMGALFLDTTSGVVERAHFLNTIQGHQLYSTANPANAKLQILDSTFDGSKHNAVMVWNGPAGSMAEIRGNTFTNITAVDDVNNSCGSNTGECGNAVSLYLQNGQTTITKNHMRSMTFSGVRVNNGTGVVIEGNEIDGANEWAIYPGECPGSNLGSCATDTVGGGNRAVGNKITNSAHGINDTNIPGRIGYTSQTSEPELIEGNVLENIRGIAIHIENAKATNNIIRGAAQCFTVGQGAIGYANLLNANACVNSGVPVAVSKDLVNTPHSQLGMITVSGAAVPGPSVPMANDTYLTITGATKANPMVLTTSSGLPTNGQVYLLSAFYGMPQVNGKLCTVASPSGSTFQCTGIDSTGYGTFAANPAADVPAMASLVYSSGTTLAYSLPSAWTDTNTRMVAAGKTPMATDTAVTAGQMPALTGAVTTAAGAVATTLAAAYRTDTWSFNLGTDNASADLVGADIGPQGRIFMVPVACTVSEITVAANAGTPSVLVRKNRAGTQSNLLSGTLATGAAGAVACAATGSACADGTSKSGTVSIVTTSSTNVLATGDWIETTSGVASTGAKRLSVAVTCVRN